MRAHALPCLQPRDRVLEHEPLRPLRPLRLRHTPLALLALADIAPEHPRGGKEDVRVRLPAPGAYVPVVRAYDVPLEVVEERGPEVRGLELEVAPLRARGDADRHAVLVQVRDELDDAGERLHRRPERVLLLAPLGEVGVDREFWRQVGKEGQQVHGSIAFSCVGYTTVQTMIV